MEKIRGVRQTKLGKWEATINHRLLPNGRVSRNFDDQDSAVRYRAKMLGILDQGVVPNELLREGIRLGQLKPSTTPTPHPAPPIALARAVMGSPPLSVVIGSYLAADTAKIAKSDRPALVTLQGLLKGNLSGVTTVWVDGWVRHMKRKERLAPGTIRKKVESLARAIDWWWRQERPDTDAPMNPLRTLPKGYSRYEDGDVEPGEELPVDQVRNRRLDDAEHARIEAAAGGVKRDDRERPWSADTRDMLMLYRLIVSTGLRLREAYRLLPSDIRFDLRTIHVRRSKTGAPRDVPMTRQVEAWLREYTQGGQEIVFPFWGGIEDEVVLRQTTHRLTMRFKSLFEYAECDDLTEHDLRHEATCRWMLMRDKEGRWLFRPEEVRRITGHKNVQMFERYLSLRGSDLAERLE